MVIRPKTVGRIALFWVVICACIWYLLARWSVEADPPWTGAVDDDVITQEQDESIADVAVIVHVDGDDYFVDVRMDRERSRAEQLEWLRAVAGDERVTAEARERAGMEAVRLMDAMTMEQDVEKLIRSKGFADAVVFLFESSAVVVIKADDLTENDLICVADLVVRTTGIAVEQISIIARPE